MSGDYRSRVERKKATKQVQQKKAKKRKTTSFFKKLMITLLLFMMIGMVSGIATFAYFVKDAPPLDEAKIKDPLSSTIYDMNGHKIAELGAQGQKRTYVSYKDIPKVLEDAVLATEDVRFYQHHGFDLIRLGGAVVANLKDGFGAEGGSTITQQVVKLTFLSSEKTLKRKAQELWLALRLEQKYSKHEILEMYLNKVYYSNNVYGVAKAAEFYFGKTDLKDLTLPEAALLAGMPQSPNNYNPYEYPEAAKKRRDVVLSLMAKHGFITKEEAEKAKKVPIQSMLVDKKKHKNSNSSSVPYDSFIEEVIKEVTDQANVNVYEDGLKIYTTLDPDAQNYVDDLLNSNDLFTNKENLQSAIALIDTKTGEIRALGGGRNKNNVAFGFNYAIQRVGQPGSTIKPILDYGPAVEYLKWSTAHQLVDEPYAYSDGTPIKNWNGTYEGPMTMRMALAKSRNIPALKALQAVGKERAKQFANKLGMGFDEIYESYAIGGLGKGVSPLQMAGAYSAFGNNGVYIKPHAVTKIVFPDDTEMDLTPKPKVAMKDYTAYMITDMLKSVVQYGTGTLANVPGLHIAGKTGTTNYDDDTIRKYGLPDGAVPDSWFVGYTPNYTAAVWTGFSKRSSEAYLSTYEQKIPRLLFKKVIAHVDDGSGDFKMPKSVVKLPIKKGSNPPKLAGKYTPESEIVYECFVRGTQPTEVAEDRPEPLSPVTNLQGVYDPVTNTITVSWKYGGQLENGSFEVHIKNDKGESNVVTTNESSLTVNNPTPGAVYTFEVYVINKEEENRSEPASTTVQVPGGEQNEQNGDNQGQTSPSDENGNNGQQPNGNENNNNSGNNGTNNGNSGENNNNGDSGNNTTPTPPATNPTTPPPQNGGNGGGTGNNSTNNNNTGTNTNQTNPLQRPDDVPAANPNR
ncbi:PBP1A family penicillin-binding protein [Thermaerobacillus caldiproteolyticus]|uniref:Penicillin-binding protein 1A n=1 Tax=Thermaerobacillus caldiproteolyticus TaxID=247480 RepID=A0A7V9Z6S8_9BACL|nr:PBP1A family penicillin-binding protein [Anoxybacillus caldiproteolyticus]MBA2875073.1 penicillin-binding protein 1A [Anoxybacillus caldiproteolyticus]